MKIKNPLSKLDEISDLLLQMIWEQIHKDNSIVEVDIVCTFLRHADGTPKGILGISRNVTEHKKIERKLIESIEKYHTTLENIKEGYLELDLRGNFNFINDCLCNNLEYKNYDL